MARRLEGDIYKASAAGRHPAGRKHLSIVIASRILQSAIERRKGRVAVHSLRVESRYMQGGMNRP
jgi:hypothetical protein